MAKKPRPRLDDDAGKPAATKSKAAAARDEKAEVAALVEERYRLHQAIRTNTVASILKEAALCVESHRELEKRGAVRQFLGKLGENRQWLSRMCQIGLHGPFKELSQEDMNRLPAKMTHLAELTKVREDDWPKALEVVTPDMSKREMLKAIKDFIPPTNKGPQTSSPGPDAQLETLVNKITALIEENKNNPVLVAAARDQLEMLLSRMPT